MAQLAIRGRVYTRIIMQAILMTMEFDGDDDEGSFPVFVTIRVKIITRSEYK